MLNGLRTATYLVPDLTHATAWYTDVLGHPPYFEEPYYVGFNVGGYELGLLPADGEHAPDDTPSVVPYWGVNDIHAAVERLQSKGATVHENIRDVGEGIQLATLHDPFGNLLGIIENPHFEVE